MLINDLNHLEIVEDTQISGGRRTISRKEPVAIAGADAFSDAIGSKFTKTSTYTETAAVAGAYSSSISSSYAKAVGG